MKEKNEMNSATWLNMTPHIIRTIYLPASKTEAVSALYVPKNSFPPGGRGTRLNKP